MRREFDILEGDVLIENGLQTSSLVLSGITAMPPNPLGHCRAPRRSSGRILKPPGRAPDSAGESLPFVRGRLVGSATLSTHAEFF